MTGVCPIELIVQIALSEQAPTYNLYNQFCMAELLLKINIQPAKHTADICIPKLFGAFVHEKSAVSASCHARDMSVVVTDIKRKGTYQISGDSAFGVCCYFFYKCVGSVKHDLKGDRRLFSFDDLKAKRTDVLPKRK